MHREYSSPFPAKVIIEKDKILTENANKTYHYGRIMADSFTPYPKNPIIANFFNNIGRADELGSGVRNLFKYTKMYADSDPVMFEDDVFRVEVPLFKNDNEAINSDNGAINGDNGAINGDNGAINGDNGAINSDNGVINGDNRAIKNLDKREVIIYQYIIENGSVSNSQACELLGLKPPTVRKIFRKMIDKSIIYPTGGKRKQKVFVDKIMGFHYYHITVKTLYSHIGEPIARPVARGGSGVPPPFAKILLGFGAQPQSVSPKGKTNTARVWRAEPG